jgi:hypothetical protein
MFVMKNDEEEEESSRGTSAFVDLIPEVKE